MIEVYKKRFLRIYVYDVLCRDQTGERRANGSRPIDPFRRTFAGQKHAELVAKSVTIPLEKVVGSAMPIGRAIQLVQDKRECFDLGHYGRRSSCCSIGSGGSSTGGKRRSGSRRGGFVGI
jgi:hypothetical protein